MIKIPKIVFNVLNEKHNFDYLFLEKLKKHERAEDAYDAAIEQIKKYAPQYKHSFVDYNSYRAKLHFRTKGYKQAPKEIINAVTGGFDDMVDYYYKIHYNRKKAYDVSLRKINKYFPKYKPYKNYLSYVNSKSYRAKVKKVTRKG